MSRDLTKGEMEWLNSRGGREQADVEWNGQQPVVMMRTPKGEVELVPVEEFKRERVPSRGRSQVI